MTFTNLGYKIHYTRGADIAAAPTLPLFSDGDYVHVTGADTITRLAPLEKGMQVVLEFQGSCILVHDAEYLILPEGSNIITVSGDAFRFIQYDTGGKWRMVNDGAGGGGVSTGIFGTTKSKASLGAQILVNNEFTSDLSGWTAAAGWQWSALDGGSAEHTTGNGTLSQDYHVDEDVCYYGFITVSNYVPNSGFLTVDIGGITIPVTDLTPNIMATGTYNGSLKAWGTGDTTVTITPSTVFNGRISEVSFYPIIPAIPAVKVIDEDLVDVIDIMGDDELDNTFVGAESGLNSYTAHDNICFGKNSGESLITGSYNTIIGKDAGEDCTMGHDNTLIGSDAGAKIIAGCANTFIGRQSGAEITLGHRNTCVGLLTGNKLSGSVVNNSYFGAYSGAVATTGDSNAGFGAFSGRVLTTGERNTMIGAYSYNGLTTGGHNTGLGYGTLSFCNTGTYNIGIGEFAGRNYSGGSLYAPTKCVFIGYNAKSQDVLPDSEVVIGAYEPVGNGSHTTTIGDSGNTDTYLVGNARVSTGLFVTGNTTHTGTTTHTGATTCNSVLNVNAGIKFPATDVPSADPNTIDDYEEGTFTPVLEFAGSTSGITYVHAHGAYTKIGSTVFIKIAIGLSNKGSHASGASATITGLPFATENRAYNLTTLTMRSFNVYNDVYCTNWIAPNSTTIILGYSAGGIGVWSTFSQNDFAAFNNNSELYFQGHYRI